VSGRRKEMAPNKKQIGLLPKGDDDVRFCIQIADKHTGTNRQFYIIFEFK
jgi:hypothetical protein